MIKPEKFVTGVRAFRYLKKELVREDDTWRSIRWGSRSFKKDQILVETDTAYIVSPIRVVGSGTLLPTATLDHSWSLVTDFIADCMKARGQDSNDLLRSGFNHPPVLMEDIDKALNVAQDMGRWDMAFKMVANLLGLSRVGPEHVVWERFPHNSKMLLMTGATTGIFLTGAMKDVVEKWWAYCGGYHNKRDVYLVPDEDYEDFMSGVRNPFALAGLDRNAARESIEQNLHPVEVIPPPISKARLEKSGRDWWVHDGVVYLASVDGSVLPYWYTDVKTGKAPEKIGWDAELKKKLAANMNLPLLVQRGVAKHYA